MPDYTYDEKTKTLTLHPSITTTESLGGLKPVNVRFANGDWCGKDDIINDILKVVCGGNGYLKSCDLPDGLTRIDDWAFRFCSDLTSITIPNSVTEIGDRAFSNCQKLTNVTIPKSVETIGCGAFSRCFGLTSVAIPGSVKKIHVSIFDKCVGLTKITFCGDVNMGAWDDTYFNSVPGLQTIEVCSEHMKNRVRDHLERRDVSVVVLQNAQTNPNGSVSCRKKIPPVIPYNNRGR